MKNLHIIFKILSLANNLQIFTNNKNMAYYSYHATAIKLIKTAHCTRAEFKEKHNLVSPALVLYFDNHKPMPIKQEHFEKYKTILNFYEIPIYNFINTSK